MDIWEYWPPRDKTSSRLALSIVLSLAPSLHHLLTSLVPGGSEVKGSASNAGDPGSIPGSGRSPGEGNGNPLWYSCLENPMDGGTWYATVNGVAKSQTQLSDFTFTFTSLRMRYLQWSFMSSLHVFIS